MAEEFLDVFEVGPGGLEKCRGAVTQVVKPDRGQSGVVDEAFEAPGDGLGVPCLPAGLNEEEPGVRPRAATDQLPPGPAGQVDAQGDESKTVQGLWHTLATGERRRITAPPGCFDVLAAFSPDGHTIATLSEGADDTGFIDLIEAATGARRRLWSFRGGASVLLALIAWSPDGRLIAATYYHVPTEELATAVVDAETGTVVADHEYRVILGCPNGTWLDNQQLLVFDDSGEDTSPLYLLDVRNGNAQPLPKSPQWRYYLALIDGRLLARAGDGDGDGDGDLYLTDLCGNDPQPFLTMATDYGISAFDVAPCAIDKR